MYVKTGFTGNCRVGPGGASALDEDAGIVADTLGCRFGPGDMPPEPLQPAPLPRSGVAI